MGNTVSSDDSRALLGEEEEASKAEAEKLSLAASSSGAGAVFGFPETTELTTIALSQLERTLEHLLLSENCHLKDAKAHFPGIIESESPPLRFLQCENYNPWGAARRLVNYWETRVDVLGPKSLSKLLLLSDNSILEEGDKSLLRQGAIFRLIQDGTGGTVLVLDAEEARALEADGVAGERMKGALFYLLSTCTEKAVTHQPGISVLVFTAQGDSGQFAQVKLVQFCKDLLVRVLPLQVLALHTAYLGSAPSESTTCTRKCDFEPGWNVSYTEHVRATKEYLSEDLKSLGIVVDDLPVRMGGRRGGKKHAQWYEDRLLADMKKGAIDGKIPAVAGPSSSILQAIAQGVPETASSAVRLPSLEPPPPLRSQVAKKRKAVPRQDSLETICDSSNSGQDASEVSDAAPADDDEDASRLDFIRKRNALYSRRKYHRKKIEIEVLQSNAACLKKQHVELQQEKAKLERLLQAAQEQVAMFSPGLRELEAMAGSEQQMYLARAELTLPMSQSQRTSSETLLPSAIGSDSFRLRMPSQLDPSAISSLSAQLLQQPVDIASLCGRAFDPGLFAGLQQAIAARQFPIPLPQPYTTGLQIGQANNFSNLLPQERASLSAAQASSAGDVLANYLAAQRTAANMSALGAAGPAFASNLANLGSLPQLQLQQQQGAKPQQFLTSPCTESKPLIDVLRRRRSQDGG